MEFKISKSEKEYLLKLARKALEVYFETGKEISIDVKEVPIGLKDGAATFVTLTINGELRGCIGKLEADQPLYKDVIGNVYLAAFSDSRFDPLTHDELGLINIEISILTKPEILTYSSPEDLFMKISKTKPGLIIKSGYYQATFLPQVWEDLPDADKFLNHLCQKAGLNQYYWKNYKLEVFQYSVIHFAE